MVVEVPEAEAQLEAFKSALLLALSRLPDLTRSAIADQIEEQARRLRVLRGGDQDRLAVQLEGFAHTTRLPPPSLAARRSCAVSERACRCWYGGWSRASE